MQIKLPLKSTLFNNIQRDKDSGGNFVDSRFQVNNVSIIEVCQEHFVQIIIIMSIFILCIF